MSIERPLELKRLAASARPLVDELFLAANAQADFTPFVNDFDRRVSLNALTVLIDETQARFDDPVASDAWLAPRLYAALRLTPREAADRTLWEFLALVAYPDYIRWRWTPKTAKRNFNKDNFIGSLNQQGLSRLWWSAELLRNGRDYSAVRKAHNLQDITSTLLALDLVHHRALAIVSVEYAYEARRTGRMSGRDVVNKLIAKKLRAAMMTKSIDEIAPIPILSDSVTVKNWIGTIVDPRDVVLTDDNEVPAPDDIAIPAATLDAVKRLLETIAPLPEMV